MPEEFNSDAAKDFEEEPKAPEKAEPRQDLKMVIEALLADETSLQALATALAPLLGLTGTDKAAELPDEADEADAE